MTALQWLRAGVQNFWPIHLKRSVRSARSVLHRRQQSGFTGRIDACRTRNAQTVEMFLCLRAHDELARSIAFWAARMTARANTPSWVQDEKQKQQSPDGMVKGGAGGKHPEHGETRTTTTYHARWDVSLKLCCVMASHSALTPPCAARLHRLATRPHAQRAEQAGLKA